ncbi:MAG: hypothetical protein JXL97_02885 [Bacteroidales bacterium]|nr:hypothetical protein [Bacteroidales bacterium]
MRNLTIILLLLSSIFFSACNEQGGPKEGELIYKITYLQSERENPLVALLPKTVSMRFKDDNTAIYVEGFFGTFQLKFITNRKEKVSYTVLRIMDKKYISVNHIDSLNAGYEDFSNMQITKNPNDTISFAGLLCYQARVLCAQMSDTAVSVYYTYDIDIEEPNSNSPYSQIDGVLAKFQTRVAGIDMVFELVEFNNIQIDDSEFIFPTDYEEITNQELNEILESFQE